MRVARRVHRLTLVIGTELTPMYLLVRSHPSPIVWDEKVRRLTEAGGRFVDLAEEGI